MRNRYPQSAPSRGQGDPMYYEAGASSIGGDPDYGLPSDRWAEEGSEDFGHAGESSGRHSAQRARPGGRGSYRDEEMSRRQAEDYGRDPFDRGSASIESNRRGLNSDRLRSGSRPGHWGDDQDDSGANRTAWWSQGYGDNPAARPWDDVPRDRKGPRGYARSDERIREHICESLARQHVLEVSDVEVNVRDGCVSLEGTVPYRYMKHAIEDSADNCWGVKDVDNRIRVAPRSGPIPAQATDGLESEPRKSAPEPLGASAPSRSRGGPKNG